MSSNISILLVDDDLQVLRSTAEWLGSYGFPVLAARNTESAVEILSEKSIDLAFVDLCLGPESGMDLLLLIKETHPQIPVVFLSGHASIEDAMMAVRCGAADFLTKPLADDKILEIIENQTKIKESNEKNGRIPISGQAQGRGSESDRGIRSSGTHSESAERSGRTTKNAGRTSNARVASDFRFTSDRVASDSRFATDRIASDSCFATDRVASDSRFATDRIASDSCFATDRVASDSSPAQLAALESRVPHLSFSQAGIVGADPAMNRVYEIVERIADTRATVLITGESGTGKSLLARTIHRASRRKGPFVEVACGALPETLLESELFGHEAGAFTGAIAKKIGRFLQADGGTIFLDEIGTASTALQIKLLRVLQEFEFEPVGSTKTQKVDARVILATNEDLTRAVAEGRFRQDLYYRINVINLEVPPLRKRTEDVPLLAHFFLEKTCRECGRTVRGFDSETLELMTRYPWPGNVRELQNVVERMVLLGNSPWLGPEDLPEMIRHFPENSPKTETPEKIGLSGLSGSPGLSGSSGLSGSPGADGWNGPGGLRFLEESDWESENRSILKSSLSVPERQIILEALEAHRWSRTLTAEFLGINRTTLYKKMKKFQLRAQKTDS